MESRTDRDEPSRFERRADWLEQMFGRIDIYLFDQLLRGRIARGMRIFDGGCGDGRNLLFLLREGYDVHAVDRSDRSVEAARALAKEIAPDLPPEQIRVAELRDLPFDDAQFDVVLCNAVLHFSAGPDEFIRGLDELWRVLAPGGLFFARLASSIGIEDRIVPIGENRFRLPDGSDRFLVSEEDLLQHASRLGGGLLDPIKTTNVQGQRCMTTWVMRKP